MSRENLEIVQRIYDAFAEGDLEGAMRCFDADVEWSEPPESPGADTPYRGRDGARRSLDAWLHAWDHYELEVDELIDAGKQILVRSRQRVRGKGSGIEIDQPLFNLWTLRDGRVIRMRMYHDEGAARNAAGIGD